MKQLIKRILPQELRHTVGRVRAGIRARRLSRLSVADAFDEIYRKEYWKQGTSLSGVGSEGEWVERYVNLVRDLATALDLRTAVDAGCGDFNVGRELAPRFSEYKALDVSSYIIKKNRVAFGHLANVEFKSCNLIEDRVPPADLVMIRQVLQHLTNQQVHRILENVWSSASRYLLVAEEHPIDSAFRPNRDLESHSVLTRLDAGSAVDITAPPFNRQARLIASFTAGNGGNSVLAVYLAKLR